MKTNIKQIWHLELNQSQISMLRGGMEGPLFSDIPISTGENEKKKRVTRNRLVFKNQISFRG